jgi:hypothetical protein
MVSFLWVRRPKAFPDFLFLVLPVNIFGFAAMQQRSFDMTPVRDQHAAARVLSYDCATADSLPCIALKWSAFAAHRRAGDTSRSCFVNDRCDQSRTGAVAQYGC